MENDPNLLFNIIGWANIFMSLVLYAVFSQTVLGAKKRPFWTALLYVAICFAVYAATYPIRGILYLKIPIALATDYLCIFFLFRGTWKFKTFFWVIKTLVNYLTEFITSLVIHPLLRLPDDFNYFVPSNEVAIGTTFANGILLLLIFLFAFLLKRLFFKVKGRELLWFALFPLNQLLLLGGMLHNTNSQYTDTMVIFASACVAFSLLVDIFLLWVLNDSSKKTRAQERLAFLDTISEMEEDYYEVVQRYIYDMKALKHDFRDQLQTAVGLIGRKTDADNQSAIKLLNAIGGEISGLDAVELCENRVVNTILMTKKEQAEQAGIRFEADAAIPEACGVEKLDLCTLFCNILNNAIEACEKVEAQKRHILLHAESKAGCLIVKTENSVEEPPVMVKGRPVTTKDDSASHGFGTEKLTRLAKKYGGEIKYDVSGNDFSVTIMLMEQALTNEA